MLTRRMFLKAGGVALFTLGVGGGPRFLTRAAAGRAGHRRDRRRAGARCW